MKTLASVVERACGRDSNLCFNLKVKCAKFLGAYDAGRSETIELLAILTPDEWYEIQCFSEKLCRNNIITKLEHLQCKGTLITVAAPSHLSVG